MNTELERRFRAIRWLVLDVDGVLTDGSVIYSGTGAEIKAFHVRDGFGLRVWRDSGRGVAVITGRKSRAVSRRCRELGIAPAIQSARDKRSAFAALIRTIKVQPNEVAAVGDDLPDLPMLQAAGVSFAVADAAEEVRMAVDMVARTRGGNGAVREIIELILKAQGEWDRLTEQFHKPSERLRSA